MNPFLSRLTKTTFSSFTPPLDELTPHHLEDARLAASPDAGYYLYDVAGVIEAPDFFAVMETLFVIYSFYVALNSVFIVPIGVF